MKACTSYKELITQALKNKKLKIHNDQKTIKAIVEYHTINDIHFTKILFDDESMLVIYPRQMELYYAHDHIIQTDIPIQNINNKENIEYHGEEYTLINPNDYQYIKHFRLGDLQEVVGECHTWTYTNTTKNKLLTFAIRARDGIRVDSNPMLIEMKYIHY